MLNPGERVTIARVFFQETTDELLAQATISMDGSLTSSSCSLIYNDYQYGLYVEDFSLYYSIRIEYGNLKEECKALFTLTSSSTEDTLQVVLALVYLDFNEAMERNLRQDSEEIDVDLSSRFDQAWTIGEWYNP